MNKAERLLKLISYLRSRRTAVTAQALADHLGVSERTIYRDIQSLVLSGVPVDGEAGVGYLLDPRATLAPLMFTEQEIEAVMLGTRLVRAWGDDDMHDAADSALEKIRAVLPETMLHSLSRRRTPFLVPDNARSDKVRHGKTLREAIHKHRVLSLDYTDVEGKSSRRCVEPLGLVFWGASWTLIAWCRLREDFRSFRLDRMQGAKLQDENFEVRDGRALEDYLRQYYPDIDTGYWAV